MRPFLFVLLSLATLYARADNGSDTWNNGTPPGISLWSGVSNTITVTAGAGGILNIPASVTELTINGGSGATINGSISVATASLGVTLNLNNVTINSNYAPGAVYTTSSGMLTLNIAGSVTLNGLTNNGGNTLYASRLTIGGAGTLYINGADNAGGQGGRGISVSELTINAGCTVYATGGAGGSSLDGGTGVLVSGTFINSGTLFAQGGGSDSGNGYNGITCLVLDNYGTITATGGVGGNSTTGTGGVGGRGIYISDNGNLTNWSGGKITATGGVGGYSSTGAGGDGGYGIYGATYTNITNESGGKITVFGGDGGSSTGGAGGNGQCGIYVPTTGTITNANASDFKVSGGSGGNGTPPGNNRQAISRTHTFPIYYSPYISGNPSNQVVNAGQNTTFSVSADGNPTPTYQWEVSTDGGLTWGNVSNGGIYSDATTDMLTLTGVASTDNGNRYRCNVINSVKTVISGDATLTVNTAPPTITGPTAMTLTEGYTATTTGVYTTTGYPAPVVTTSGNASITWDNVNRQLDIAAGLTSGTYPVVLTANNGITPNATITFTLTVNAPPTITGTIAMTLVEGYTATTTGVYTITGYPAPTVTKTSGNAAITWDNIANRLDIAAGLAAGVYPVVITASNSIMPDATLTFTLTVATASPPPVPVGISGPTSMTLTTGYAATSTEAYILSGSTPVTVTKQSGDTHITWNSTTRRLDIAAGLPAGTYEVKLRAENRSSSRTLTFTLTVQNPVYFIDATRRFTGGTVTTKTGNPNPYLAESGTTVTLTVTPDAGYVLDSIMVLLPDGTAITLTAEGGGVYTFTMPASHITVVAVFATLTGFETLLGSGQLKAFAQNGALFVSGLTGGQRWSVYNILGIQVYQGIAGSDKTEIVLPGRGIYIVTDGKDTIKVNN